MAGLSILAHIPTPPADFLFSHVGQKKHSSMTFHSLHSFPGRFMLTQELKSVFILTQAAGRAPHRACSLWVVHSPIVVCSSTCTSRKLLILTQRLVLSSSRTGRGFPLWFCARSELGEQPRGHEFLLCMWLAVDFTHILDCFYSSHDFRMWL